jgi:LacI family transcriptional regulator
MKVTLKDIAEQVNVSISTVSRVLNNAPSSIADETRLRIFQVAEELGYKRTKKTGQTNRKISEKQIGCILCNMKDKYQDPYFSEIIYGIERELLDQGYMLSFTYDTQDLIQSDCFEELLQGENLGVICVGPMNADFLEEVSRKVPFLISAGGNPELDIDYVTVDFAKAAMKATRYLIRLGHRKIACIGGSSPLAGIPMTEEARFVGYMKALSIHGVPIISNLTKDGHFNEEDSYIAMKQILSGKVRPTALFTTSDRMAYGAYKAIREAGLSVPGDIAVVSFDDLKMSEFVDPPLTTIRVHKEELGRITVKMLLQRMDGNLPFPITSYLPTQLIVRKSCGQLR